jgi:hypothetical protein
VTPAIKGQFEVVGFLSFVADAADNLPVPVGALEAVMAGRDVLVGGGVGPSITNSPLSPLTSTMVLPGWAELALNSIC